MTPPSNSAWAPLRHPLFRGRWIANLLSNTGGWMQDTAATWLMTALTSSPLLIALMQTAASLPVLILGLPSGAIADILDRRRLLLFWQSWMLVVAVILSVLGFGGLLGPWMLLSLTLLLNVGVAMNNPAWQAIIPELVPRNELPNAISLNSAGFNLARAMGPALGGLMVAAFASVVYGASSVFFLNALSFIFVILVLYRWKRQPLHTSDLPAERMMGSMRAGIRYVRHTPEIRSVLIRAFIVTSCVSAMWALLAVVAQRDLKHGALGYGLLNACIGAGAVAGAILLPRARSRFHPDFIVSASSVVFAITLLAMAYAHQTVLIVAALLLGGFAWTSTMSTFNIAVQVSAPSWVQARALGTYQMIFQAGMAIGSAFWGAVAERFSTPTALAVAAGAMLAGMPLALRYRLPSTSMGDLTSAKAKGLIGSTPMVEIDPQPTDGPVLISVEYHIDPADAAAFNCAVYELKHVRLRDGAFRWGLFRDAARGDRYTERFLVESWAEYLRQRERLTVDDLKIRQKAASYHRGEGAPEVSRMIYTPVAPAETCAPGDAPAGSGEQGKDSST